MKELKELPKKERIEVLIQCCSFFLSYHKHKSTKPIFDKLSKEFNLTKAHDKEIWMLITMIGRSLKSGCTGSQVSLNSKNYRAANKIHNMKLHEKRVRNVLIKAEELGYIDFYKGYFDYKTDTSVMSCVVYKKILIDMFPDKLLIMFSKSVSANEMVEVKDAEGNCYTKLTRFKGLVEHRNLMLKYNNLLSLHDIRFGFRKCYVAYKQIFSLDLNGAGRIYSFGGFQTMKSEYRNKLTINGESVTEVDIKANHISMMYLLEGITLDEDFDAYSIDLTGFDYKDVRGLCKYAVMCMINCKTKMASVFALKKIVNQDDKSKLSCFKGEDDNFFKVVINKLISKHSRLVFFKRGDVLWRKLQRLDSRVSEFVIKNFTEEEVPVLGWHDSWVIGKQYRSRLIETIKMSWYKVFGTHDNCFVRIEY